jgi:hypothetical protein
MKRKRSFRTVRTALVQRSEYYPQKSVHAERHIARGIRAALRLELWRRQRARELMLEAQSHLETDALERLLKSERVQ